MYIYIYIIIYIYIYICVCVCVCMCVCEFNEVRLELICGVASPVLLLVNTLMWRHLN